MAGKKGWVDWGKWGTRAMVVSDALGTRANAAGASTGRPSLSDRAVLLTRTASQRWA